MSPPFHRRHHHHHRREYSERKLNEKHFKKENIRETTYTSRNHSKEHKESRHESKHHKAKKHYKRQHRSRSPEVQKRRSSNKQSTKEEINQTFIGEMLRNSSQKSNEENVKLLNEALKISKESSKTSEDSQLSYTPPIHLLRVSCQTSSTPVTVSNDNVKESPLKPKKKSVLELPMPIIFPKIVQRNVLKQTESSPPTSQSTQETVSKEINNQETPKTPEIEPFTPKRQKPAAQINQVPSKTQTSGKASVLKQDLKHFMEVQKHLTSNEVIISPLENIAEKQFTSKKKRPVILKRSPPIIDFQDRDFNTFKIVKLVGEGTYGKVFKAIDLLTKEVVAMKLVRMEKESEGFPITALREVKILREINHRNIVQLREIVYQNDLKCKDTYLVFDYMEHDLMGLLDNEEMIFDESSIYRMFKQLLEGLNYCHERRIIHRDLKCSNILVGKDGTVKLADFGLGRHWIADRPYTNLVISLWYRPIELLLGEEKYDTSVDIWSLGCILGELFQRRPVFPFGSDIEMITGIFNICGSPTKHSWPEIKYLPGYKTLKPKYFSRKIFETFKQIIPPLALDVLDKMLCLNPRQRITASEALKSNWMIVMGDRKFPYSIKLPIERDCHELDAKARRKKRCE